MKKIKFFLDPISNLETWLNGMAEKGYRLKSIRNFIYEFERTENDYRYLTQFIGVNSSKENKDYIQMLKENGTRIYRAPLNQGNIAFGKVRLRPYAHGDGKIANSFQGYNKEILVVENYGKELGSLLTNKSDLADYYKNVRNAYVLPFIIILALFGYLLYRNKFDQVQIAYILIVGLVILIISAILYKMQKNYKKYKKESELID